MNISEFNNTYKSLSKDAARTFLQKHSQENLPSSEGFKCADSLPSTKHIPMSVLFELEDAVDIYEGLSAALSDRNSIPDEIYDDVAEKKDEALYKMCQIAKQLTAGLPVDNQ